MNIEDTQPLSVLADRVWAGSSYIYPNLNKLVAETAQLRADLARVTGERDRWRAAAVDIRIVAMERWSFDGDQQHTHTWHDRADFAAWSNQKLRDTITPPTGG